MSDLTGTNNVDEIKANTESGETVDTASTVEKKTKKKAVATDATKLRQARAELGTLRKQVDELTEEIDIAKNKHLVLFNSNQSLKAENRALISKVELIVNTFMSSTQSTLQTTGAMFNSMIKK